MSQRSGLIDEFNAWLPKEGMTESSISLPTCYHTTALASSTPAAIGHWRAQTYSAALII